MAQSPKKVRVAANHPSSKNPKRSNRPAHSSRPTNAAPKKGNKHMATKKHSKAANGSKKKHNPAAKKTNHRRRLRHNPEWLGSPKDLLVTSVAGLANAVLTRQLPQLVLSSGNTGVEGYAANAVVALAGAWAAAKFVGPKAGSAALVGGMVILLDRILTEQVSPIGPYLTLSGVGDATAMTKMGTIRDGYYTHPGLVDANGNLMAPDPYTQQAVAAVLAAYPQIAAPVMAAVQSSAPQGHSVHAVNPSALRRHTASGQLLSSRFQGRFNQSLN
jgi:hypothetical protein